MTRVLAGLLWRLVLWQLFRRLRGLGWWLVGPIAFAAGLASLRRHARLWPRDRELAQVWRARQAAAPEPLAATPPVTVLVAAWNEAEHIDAHVRSVLGLSYPDLQFVLCAGGPDGTYERAARYARDGIVVLEQQPGEGKQAALRRAFAHVTGEIVFLSDADCQLDDTTLQRTIAPLVNAGEVAATGGSWPTNADRPLARLLALRELYLALRAPEYSPGLHGRNCALWRWLIVEIDGFGKSARTGTDYRLARAVIQAGYRIKLVEHSRIRSHFESEPGTYARQQSRWLRNLVYHGLATGDRVQVRAAATTIAAGTALVFGPLATLLAGPLALAAWLSLVCHVLATRCYQTAVASLVAPRGRSRSALAAIPFWLAVDAVTWVQAAVQLARSNWRLRW